MSTVELVTVSEAANLLSIGRTKAYELVAAGRLPSVRIGRSVRVPVRALTEWVDRSTVGPKTVD